MRRSLRAIPALFLIAAALLAGPRPATGASLLTPVNTFTTPRFSAYYGQNTSELFSSPAIGDVDGDGQPDVVAGFPDGKVYLWHTNGTLFRTLNTGAGAVHGSPVLYDLNGDGVLDVLAANSAGRVVGFSGSTGGVLFDANHPCAPNYSCGIFSTPTVGDIDHDGSPDIVAGSWDQHLWAWHLDGSTLAGFPVDVYDSIWSSPSLADLDGDGWLEIVVGGDSDGVQGQPYPRGGLLWVFRHDGARQPGFPKFIAGQVIWSTPAVSDLYRNGQLDIVFGTGLNFPAPAGQNVFGVDSHGNALTGLPVSTSGRTMSSPAIGDVNGDGAPDIVTMADDGRIYAWTHQGNLLPGFPQCNANNRGSCPVGLHGSVSLADLDGDGKQDIVSGGEQWLRVFGGDGSVKAEVPTVSGTLPLVSAPSVTSINNQAWVVQSSGFTDGGSTATMGKVWIWRTSGPLASAAWPTFKQNFRRTGSILDATPPTAALDPLASTQGTTRAAVSWSGADSESGIASFDVDTRDNGGAWVRWLSQAKPSARSGASASGGQGLFGTPGHTYDVRVRSLDRAGNASPWTASRTTTFSNTASRVQPFAGAYASSGFGDLAALDSPPAQGPSWPGWNVGRGVATRAAGGGYELDAFGGVHPFGGAPSVATTGYWSGWDITRGIALNADGSGYVLDGWGALHPFGGAARVTNGPYWAGWDIAKAIVLTPTSTKDNPAGYVLDAFGGVHPFGSATPVATTGYWRGWNIARGLALGSNGHSGYVLDGYGGLHPFGGAPSVASGGYWSGWDIARGVAVAANGQSGWVLDGFGGVHPFGGAPVLEASAYWGRDIARAISVAP